GWMDISDSKQGVAVGIYNFASQTPKELFTSADGSLEARLWPARYPQGKDSANYSRGGYEVDRFYIGMAEHKTHEVLFHFHGGSAVTAATPAKMAAFNHRILPTMDSKWVSLSRAVLSEMSPDTLPSPDPSIASNQMPLINKVLGDPSYVKGTSISKYYYDTWVNYGESYARNDRNSTEYYENQGIRYLRCPTPQALRLLEGTAWVAADMRQCHLDSMVGIDNRMSLHFWLGDSTKVVDPKHHVYPTVTTTNIGRFRLWIAPTPGAQTEHYTSFDLFNYYLLTGDLKIRDAIYEWGESNADYKSFINTNGGMSGMGRGSNSAWCTMMFAALIENSDTVRGGRTFKKYFEDQLHTWTQGLPGKKGILASLGPSGAWGTFVHANFEGPHNYFEALVDFGFSWYAENYWNDSLKTYFDRRIKCMRDSVFTKTGNIMYHGWGYYDSTTPPSQTAPSNYRIPGSLARLFYFSGDTIFERKMNTFCMEGKSPVFAQQDLQFMGRYDMTVYQPYLFYLNNKTNYRKNPIIDWEYPDHVEQGDYKNSSTKLSLSASPNPFNPAVTIKLSEMMHGISLQSMVLFKIVTPDGRTMLEKQFTAEDLTKGFTWNGHDTNNKPMATGIYFVKIDVLGKSAVKRVMLIK
ncbi:MAG: hypothetical protein JNL74_01520, partial [Fibrobacteres bacterium]|nr:hypothetical protein [Fibrobacterota bacterium]